MERLRERNAAILFPDCMTTRSTSKSVCRPKPDSTLTELCAWLRQEHQMEASVALMAKTLGQLGLTLKKRRSMQLNRTVPDVAEKRAAWRDGQATLDATKLIFVDETWVKTNMVRLRGRALAGPAAGRQNRARPLENINLHCRSAP